MLRLKKKKRCACSFNRRYREGIANGEDLASLKVSDPNNAQHYRPGSKNNNNNNNNNKNPRGAGGGGGGGGGGKDKDEDGGKKRGGSGGRDVKEYSYDKGTGTQHK